METDKDSGLMFYLFMGSLLVGFVGVVVFIIYSMFS